METLDLDFAGLNVYLHFAGDHRWMPLRRAISLPGFRGHHDLAPVLSMICDEGPLANDIAPSRRPDDIRVGNRPVWGSPYHDSPVLQNQILFGRLELLRCRVQQLLVNVLNGKSDGRTHTIG